MRAPPSTTVLALCLNIASLACLALITVQSGRTLQASTMPFADVPANHPAYSAVISLQEKGVIEGGVDGLFRPDAPIDRAAFLKLVMSPVVPATERAQCLMENGTFAFRDTPPLVQAWYGPYLCAGMTRNIVKGYNDGTFQPEQPINLAEAAHIITKAYGLKPEQMLWPADAYWYAEGISAVYELAIIPASVRNISQKLTRGEVAQMIRRIIDIAGIQLQTPAEPLSPTQPVMQPVQPTDPAPTLTPTPPASSDAEQERLRLMQEEILRNVQRGREDLAR